MATSRGVGMLFGAKGVDGHGRAAAIGGTAQHTGAGGIVDVELLVG